MATLQKKFEQLDVWQDAIQMAKQIYILSKNEIFNDDLSLKDQLRRTAVSVSNHIAEGFDQQSNTLFIKFLKIAKGNCSELRSMILLMHEMEYIDLIEKKKFDTMTIGLSNKIAALLQYLKPQKEN